MYLHILPHVSRVITKHTLDFTLHKTVHASLYQTSARKALQSAADKSFLLAAPALWNNLPSYFYSHSKLSVIIQKMFKNSLISSVD